jgi:hypothetical protein
MKRTKYFQNTSCATALKRVTSDDKITCFSTGYLEWDKSLYTVKELNVEAHFRQITRDQARKIHPKAFKTPFNVVLAIRPTS